MRYASSKVGEWVTQRVNGVLFAFQVPGLGLTSPDVDRRVVCGPLHSRLYYCVEEHELDALPGNSHIRG